MVTIKGNSGAPLSPPSPPPLSPSLTPPSFSLFRPFPHSHILLLLLAKLHDLHEYWTYIAITMEHYFFALLTKQRQDWTYKFIDELVKNQWLQAIQPIDELNRIWLFNWLFEVPRKEKDKNNLKVENQFWLKAIKNNRKKNRIFKVNVEFEIELTQRRSTAVAFPAAAAWISRSTGESFTMFDCWRSEVVQEDDQIIKERKTLPCCSKQKVHEQQTWGSE